MLDELDDVFAPAIAAHKESLRAAHEMWFIELLRQNKELYAEIRERFELGSSAGKYPILSEQLALLETSDVEEFFRTGGGGALRYLNPPKRMWEDEPYNGDIEWFRGDLYEGITTSSSPEDLPALSQDWLEELSRVGYRGMSLSRFGGRTESIPLKQKVDNIHAVREPVSPLDKAHPVIFKGTRQVLWLQLDGSRSERGYRNIEVSDEPLRTDKAILAALSALEGQKIDLQWLRETLSLSDLEEDSWGQSPNTRPCTAINYVLMLLRYHKPDFDSLVQEEKIELVERACAHVNELLKALQRLMAFLEYGTPGRELRSAKKDAEKHVRAAVLKHVDGLSYLAIAEELGEPIPRKYRDKGEHPTVRKWVRLGTELLESAVGKQGLHAQVDAMKAEAKRWNALSEEDQEAEEEAELQGISVEEARQYLEDWYARYEQQTITEEQGTE